MFRRIELRDTIAGQLFLHHMPGRPDRESWSAFESAARQAMVTSVVSLTPLAEIRQKSPEYAARIARESLPFAHHLLPIPDFGVPEDREEFAAAVAQIAEDLRAGRNALVHCGAGIGRTGTFAACVLIALGYSTMEAAALVRAAGATCETPAQRAVVEWFAESVRSAGGRR